MNCTNINLKRLASRVESVGSCAMPCDELKIHHIKKLFTPSQTKNISIVLQTIKKEVLCSVLEREYIQLFIRDEKNDRNDKSNEMLCVSMRKFKFTNTIAMKIYAEFLVNTHKTTFLPLFLFVETLYILFFSNRAHRELSIIRNVTIIGSTFLYFIVCYACSFAREIICGE